MRGLIRLGLLLTLCWFALITFLYIVADFNISAATNINFYLGLMLIPAAIFWALLFGAYSGASRPPNPDQGGH